MKIVKYTAEEVRQKFELDEVGNAERYSNAYRAEGGSAYRAEGGSAYRAEGVGYPRSAIAGEFPTCRASLWQWLMRP